MTDDLRESHEDSSNHQNSTTESANRGLTVGLGNHSIRANKKPRY